jgi:SMC interacting uncharacterized protein involved in chromosome segregation
MDDIQRIQNRIADKQAQIRRLQNDIDQLRKQLQRKQVDKSGEDWFSRAFGF